MNRLYQDGLLGTGATLAARLFFFEFDAVLTNEPMEDGWARWWEVLPGTGVMRKRQTPVIVPGPFPYGYPVEDP